MLRGERHIGALSTIAKMAVAREADYVLGYDPAIPITAKAEPSKAGSQLSRQKADYLSRRIIGPSSHQHGRYPTATHKIGLERGDLTPPGKILKKKTRAISPRHEARTGRGRPLF